MAGEGAAQGLKQSKQQSIREYMLKTRYVAEELTKDALSSLQYPKSRENMNMMTGLRREIDGLKEENEKQKRIIRETANETKALRQQFESLSRTFANQRADSREIERKVIEFETTISTFQESSVALIYDVRYENEANIKQVQQQMSRSNQDMRAEMANMKQVQEDIAHSNQDMRAEMANMKQVQEDIAHSNQDMRDEMTNMKQVREDIDHSNQDMRVEMANMKQVREDITNLNQDMRVEMAKMKQVGDDITNSNQSMRVKMADIKQVQGDIAHSNQGMRADIANLKRDADRKHETVVNLLSTMLERQKKQRLQAQRFASTSTLDTVDTGFGEQSVLEETEDEAESQPQDTEAQVKKRINDLALQFETRIHNLVKPLGRYLGLDEQHIKEICQRQTHGKDYRNQLFDIIDAWFHLCKRERKPITMETFLKALHNAGFRFEGLDFKVNPILATDQAIIERNVPYMARHMIVYTALTELRTSGLLNPDLVNYILEIKFETERVKRLVEILPILGDHALPALLEALRSSGQSFIAEEIMKSCSNRSNEMPLRQCRTKPSTGMCSQSHQSTTFLKQRCKGPIKETTI